MVSMSVKDIIGVLRDEVNIVNSAEGLTDVGLLDMTDEQIETLLKLGASRLDTDAEDLTEALEEGLSFPITLLGKIELFTKLATLKADLVDMNADNNNRLSLGQRFSHYSDLLEKAQDAFDKWNEDNDGSSGGTGGVITSYDVVLDNRHMTKRNYETQATPKVRLRVASVSSDSVELKWTLNGSSHFAQYKLYIGTSPVFDIYLDGGKAENKITESAKLVKTSGDIRDCYARLEGLTPDTDYYVAVIATERNGVYGYSQKLFTTTAEE